MDWNLIPTTIMSTTVGKNPLEEMEQPSQSTKESKKHYLDAVSKTKKMISVCFQGKPFNITITQVYALTSNAEEAEVEWFYEGLEDLHYRGLEWVNLTQITILSITVGKNPLEEMEQPSQSTKDPKMQYLDAISKTTG